MNIVLTVAVFVHVTKYIVGSTCMKKQMHAQQSGSCGMQDFKNNYYVYTCCACSRYQIY